MHGSAQNCRAASSLATLLARLFVSAWIEAIKACGKKMRQTLINSAATGLPCHPGFVEQL
jgi:hypothetical protein